MKKPSWMLVWNDDMSVGIREIDEDHKQFIFLINELNRSITEGMPAADIKNKLQLIVDDAERHFGEEEKLFKEWRYPDTEIHARIHVEALKALRDIKAKFIPYGLDSEWVDAGLMIKSILISHILTEDMKYADYFQSMHDVNSEKDN